MNEEWLIAKLNSITTALSAAQAETSTLAARVALLEATATVEGTPSDGGTE